MGEPTTHVPEAGAAGNVDAGNRPNSTRSPWSWRDWYLVAVVLGFIGFCLGPSLIGLRTLLSVDSLTRFYPWIAVNGPQTAGHELCTGDTIDSVMPGVAHIRTQWFGGHLANWQSLVGGGSPLAGVPNLGLLDPLSLPYLILPLWLAPAFVILLSFIAAAGGTFLFLRRLQVGRPGAILAGLIFATSGFMVMWTNWPQVRVAALIPVLFWAIERLVQRTRLVDSALIAVVVASMIFGGFPVVTGYALYLGTGYVLVRLFMLHRTELQAWIRTIGLAVCGLGLGVLLTLVQLLPFAAFLRQENLAYRSGQALGGLPFSGLITLIAPNARGLCVGGQPTIAGANPIELVAYVGAAALVLAVIGAAFGLGRRSPSERGPRAYFVVAVVVIVALGWGATSFRQVTEHLPVFADNSIDRIRSVLGFLLAALAAIGFERITSGRTAGAVSGPSDAGPSDGGASDAGPSDRDDQGPGRWLWPAVIIAVALLAGLDILGQAHHTATAGGYWPFLKHELWIPLLIVVVTVVLALGAWWRPRGGKLLAFIVIPLLVAAQGAQFFHTVLPGDARSNFYPVTGTQRFLASHLGPDRYASSQLDLYPATSLYYGLRTPTGHVFFESQWQALLTRVDPTVMKTSTFADFGAALNPATAGVQPILDRMGVRYFVQPPSGLTGTAHPLPATDGATHPTPGPVTCTLPGQPLRGVSVKLAQGIVPSDPQRGLTLHLVVHQAGRTLTGGDYFDGPVPPGAVVSIPVAGEDLPASGSASVAVTETGVRGGMSLATAGGSLACAAVGPAADHLKLVYADAGSIIYQRLDALPRIRWADRSVVIPRAGARINALDQGLPADEVVLDAPGPLASGQGASVAVATDDGDTIASRVDARGAGYLVVGDAMQSRGWSVTVDGNPATLRPADHAMVAVAVPAGTHQVAFHYRAPGQRVGALVSGLAALALLVIVGRELWARRRPRHRAGPRHRLGSASRSGPVPPTPPEAPSPGPSPTAG